MKKIKISVFTILCTLFLSFFSHAQDFDSGSTGADGDLIFDIANGTTQNFNHLAAGHNGIWDFNTITVPSGVTVTFSRPHASGTPPVIWLATGDVEINGLLNLSGQNGTVGLGSAPVGSERKGGPGGFAGGVDNGGSGYGPGGGQGGFGANGSTFGTVSGGAGQFSGLYGNRFLQPLIGGSGGGSARNKTNNTTTLIASGGGGGGAILISSSTEIRVNGQIICNGGNGAFAGGGGTGPRAISGFGSGGGIRLVADKISATGNIHAFPNGRVAIEAFDVSEFNAGVNPLAYYLNVNPTITFSMSQGSVRIVDIDGNGVASPALGRTTNPDVSFANSGPATVTVEATDIPPGTLVTVRVKSAAGGAATVTGSATLAGTVALSTASVNLTVPAGHGVIHAFASYQ